VRDIAAQWPAPSWPMALPVAPNVQFSRDDPGHNSGPSQTP
jgi:hypothetical protein